MYWGNWYYCISTGGTGTTGGATGTTGGTNVLLVVLLYYWWCKYSWSCPDNGCSHHLPSNALNLVNTPSQCHRHHHVHNNKKNAILDGCSTVDSTLDYDGIRWYSMVFNGIQWYLMVFDGI